MGGRGTAVGRTGGTREGTGEIREGTGGTTPVPGNRTRRVTEEEEEVVEEELKEEAEEEVEEEVEEEAKEGVPTVSWSPVLTPVPGPVPRYSEPVWRAAPNDANDKLLIINQLKFLGPSDILSWS